MGLLTLNQEIRTTCLSEAIRSTVTTNGLPNNHLEILMVAKDYEAFIMGGKTPSSKPRKKRSAGSKAAARGAK